MAIYFLQKRMYRYRERRMVFIHREPKDVTIQVKAQSNSRKVWKTFDELIYFDISRTRDRSLENVSI